MSPVFLSLYRLSFRLINMARMKAWIRLLRPHHWTKNLFVFTGIIFSHQWGNADLWLNVILAALSFCLVSSSVYVFNDIADREADSKHPTKCKRPIASGEISVVSARIGGIVVLLVGLSLSALVSQIALGIVVIYLLMNLAYSAGLKHVAVLDVFIIGLGFMLRILSGTAGVDIDPSQWLLLCGFMVTLFLGFGKRSAELTALEEDSGSHRKALDDYTTQMLDLLLGITAAGTILTYSLYTLSDETVAVHGTGNLVYTVPFVVYGIFRYLLLVHHKGQGGDPSTDLFRDRHLLITVLSWGALTLWLIR
jgi:4-hydroxybenzoate polyprenyltransferase